MMSAIVEVTVSGIETVSVLVSLSGSFPIQRFTGQSQVENTSVDVNHCHDTGSHQQNPFLLVIGQ